MSASTGLPGIAARLRASAKSLFAKRTRAVKLRGQGRFRLPVLLVALAAALLAVAPAAFFAPRAATAASIGASLDQCQNGAMGTPITAEPCLNGTLDGTGYANYTNGNANGNNSHWAEGSYLPYRDILTGLTPGTYSFTGHFDTIVGSLHAIDYIGAFDATETTSPTGNAFHRNDNNPCIDALGSAAGSGCAPIGTAPTPHRRSRSVPPARSHTRPTRT